MQISQALKDYGAAIGPTIAFILGIAAFVLKNAIDDQWAKCRFTTRFQNLKNLTLTSKSPPKFHPGTTDHNLLHADEARNLTNLSRFYNRLLALKLFFKTLEGDISTYGSPAQTQQFHSMKWWFEILYTEVDSYRSKANFRMEEFHFYRITELSTHLNDAASGKDLLSEYI